MHFKLGFPLYLGRYFTHLRQKFPGSIWATELSLQPKKWNVIIWRNYFRSLKTLFGIPYDIWVHFTK